MCHDIHEASVGCITPPAGYQYARLAPTKIQNVKADMAWRTFRAAAKLLFRSVISACERFVEKMPPTWYTRPHDASHPGTFRKTKCRCDAPVCDCPARRRLEGSQCPSNQPLVSSDFLEPRSAAMLVPGRDQRLSTCDTEGLALLAPQLQTTPRDCGPPVTDMRRLEDASWLDRAAKRRTGSKSPSKHWRMTAVFSSSSSFVMCLWRPCWSLNSSASVS